MQIQSTMRCHLTHVRMTIIKRQKKAKVDEVTEKREPFCIVRRNVNKHSLDGKLYGGASKTSIWCYGLVIPATQKAEVEIAGQPGQFSKFLFQNKIFKWTVV